MVQQSNLFRSVLPSNQAPPAGKGQCPRSIEPEQDDEQGLQRMYDEHEHDSVRLAYAVEHQNGLYRKMPRPGTVRRGYQNGKRADHESNQSRRNP